MDVSPFAAKGAGDPRPSYARSAGDHYRQILPTGFPPISNPARPCAGVTVPDRSFPPYPSTPLFTAIKSFSNLSFRLFCLDTSFCKPSMISSDLACEPERSSQETRSLVSCSNSRRFLATKRFSSVRPSCLLATSAFGSGSRTSSSSSKSAPENSTY